MAFAELSTLSLDRGAHFVALGGDIEIGVRLVVEVVTVGRPASRDPQRAAIDVWASDGALRIGAPWAGDWLRSRRAFQQFFAADAFGEFVGEEAFVRSVFQQPAHEERHTGQYLANGTLSAH